MDFDEKNLSRTKIINFFFRQKGLSIEDSDPNILKRRAMLFEQLFLVTICLTTKLYEEI